jgi:hypothetical protein
MKQIEHNDKYGMKYTDVWRWPEMEIWYAQYFWEDK